MAIQLVTDDICDEVRAALSVTLTEEMVPNTIILSDAFAGNAMRNITDQLPNALTTYSANDLIRIRAALIFLTAANMVYPLPRIINETFGTYRYSAETVNYDDQRELLISMAEREIAAVLTEGTTTIPLKPVIFALGCGRRGSLGRGAPPTSQPTDILIGP